MNQPTNPIARATLASLIAVGLTAASSMALAAKGDTEKCAGIVKAGKNDCGTSKSACAGTTTVRLAPSDATAVGATDPVTGRGEVRARRTAPERHVGAV